MDRRFFNSPDREYIFIPLLFLSLGLDLLAPETRPVTIVVAAVAAMPTLWDAVKAARRRVVGIDAFNTLALAASFGTLEVRSAIFIVLMLSFARLLENYTQSRTTNAIEALLKLKPTTATLERDGTLVEIAADAIVRGDILVVQTGTRVPVDGVIIHGDTQMNESSVTGESALVKKTIGDIVVSSTLNESGAFKMKATRVGKDSTIERMVALMRQAEKHKSRSEKLADRFAGGFMPVVALGGLATYLITHNITMTAALFLIACADDMAVAIPLAITAALGRAAKQGVIIKGGEWLDALSRVDTVVFDKTGTLTYGNLNVSRIDFEPGADEHSTLRLIATAEKFSEHPVGRVMFKHAFGKIGPVPDPDAFEMTKGSGVWARSRTNEIMLGSERIFQERNVPLTLRMLEKLRAARETFGRTVFLVTVNGAFAATVSVSDEPRTEAKKSIEELRAAGVKRIFMFTGDGEKVAADVSKKLGITDYSASMSPEDKLHALERLKPGTIAMVGDGINDAPALARSDVGIAMGSAGTATAVEAANIVILSDDLSRLPDMILLGRKTVSVINGDIALWVVTNLVGFALVFTGIAGPAFAAFYNFATDFVPLLNSSRLFRKR